MAASLLGFGVAAAVGSCSSGESGGDERVGVAQQLLTIGTACDADSQCSATAAHSSCWTLDTASTPVLQCHCDPTYVACGNTCVEIGSSATNCGFCGSTCDGSTCVNGVCGGSTPDAGWSVHLSSVNKVSAYTGDASVASWAHEGSQELSLNNGEMFGMANYTDTTESDGNNHAEWNTATVSDAGVVAWGTTHQKLPVIDGGVQGFDTTAATSAWSGYEYLAAIFHPSGADCLGVTAGTASTFPGTWGTNPMQCANPTADDVWDAPFLSYDLAGTTLWLSGCPHGAACWLYKKDGCTGAIGSAGCAAPFTPVSHAFSLAAARSHRIVANRCDPTAAGAFMATRSGTNDTDVELTQFFPDHTFKTCTISNAEALIPDTGCQPDGADCTGKGTVCKCGGTSTTECSGDATTTCTRDSVAPSIDLKVLSDHCYVYLGWDKSVNVTVDGGTVSRTQARAARVDVPTGGIADDEPCPTGSEPIDGDGLTANAGTWMSTIRVSKTSDHVMWYFYKDTDETYCNVEVHGYFDTQLSFATKQLVTLSASQFPVMIPPMGLEGSTMGDWISSSFIGLPGGKFYPTWAFSRATTNTSGVVCNGGHYDLDIVGREVSLF